MDKVFDLEKLSVIAVVDGAPVDITTGLTIESDFLKIQKKTKEEVKTRKGTKGESYSVNSMEDDNRGVELVYLPGSAPVVLLQSLRKSKKKFGLFISNDSSPKYKFTANECQIEEEPDTVVNGKEGFKDYTFKISATDSEQEFL